MKYISLERKNSDLQDGATRFVILLLFVCKIELYTIGKEKFRSTRWCHQICHFVVGCL